MDIAPIEVITIVNGARIARVTDPFTGQKRRHGLGTVGELLRPYLGHRAEGYAIDLPADLRDLRIVEVNFDGKPDRKGLYPAYARSASALGAPDWDTTENADKEGNDRP